MTKRRLPVTSLIESSGRRRGGAGGTRAVRVPPAQPTVEGATLLLRPIEVAASLGISRSKVFQLLAAGELPTVHIGRTTRVPQAQLNEWIACQISWQPRAPGGLLARLKSTNRASA